MTTLRIVMESLPSKTKSLLTSHKFARSPWFSPPSKKYLKDFKRIHRPRQQNVTPQAFIRKIYHTSANRYWLQICSLPQFTKGTDQNMLGTDQFLVDRRVGGGGCHDTTLVNVIHLFRNYLTQFFHRLHLKSFREHTAHDRVQDERHAFS